MAGCLFGCAMLGLAALASADSLDSRENLNATLWMQTAHEYAYSTAQVYGAATRVLPEAKDFASALVDAGAPEAVQDAPPAIILDLDETVLNTSRYAAGLIGNGQRHTEAAWEAWVASASQASAPADLVPGALAFLRAARAQGYRIFYVTNRACPAAGRRASYPHPACPQRDSTVAMAQRLGLPFADDPAAFLFRNDQDGWEGGDKSPRRRFLAGANKVVLLFGDDLGDFLPRAEVNALRAQRSPDRLVGAEGVPLARFGRQWFLLPNPSYGSWEVALANCEASDKDSQACYEARLRDKYRRLIPPLLVPVPASPAVPTPPR
jgi:5'-nucleotidase (lipoprotein e(P4) family)